MPRVSKDKRAYARFTGVHEHEEFLNRISKTLYYAKLPVTDCLSLPVTELAAEIFTGVKNGRTLERLDVEEASRISRNACVSPCSLVLALLYLERLKDCNPEYLQKVAPSELFLVSLMVASKFLNDDGEEDEVFNTEWAESGSLTLSKMNRLEKEFLKAIDWTVYVHNQDFWRRLLSLERDIAYKEAKKRGWFSYTELNTLVDAAHMVSLVQTMIGISSVCIATYIAGLITLLGSVVVATHLPGTSVTLNQQSQSRGVSNFQYNANMLRNREPDVGNDIESVIQDSISEVSETCNHSHTHSHLSKLNDSHNSENSWEWIISPVRFWLPNCSVINLNTAVNYLDLHPHQSRVYTTDADKPLESNLFTQLCNNDLKTIIKGNLVPNSMSHDLMYYMNYLLQISLSRGQ
ncbi:hypothetical protein QAD02_015819 [Eretmocerus hayati]|uniref:Uncharacterized protein n=1 Tax=Eretmocerus hayati TaxID=131215 RepID=A0ACC2P9Q3_9HYME|nr:hypothetical protein QAD02_015819 [Eretmocerus hayati]